MLYIAGIIFSFLIVAGNSLYKLAVERAAFEPTIGYILSKKMLGFLFSWQFVAGVSVFLVASILSFWMLSKFQFSTIQAVTVPVVLAFSYMVGAWFFKDTISVLNIVGFFVIAAGVVLASIK